MYKYLALAASLMLISGCESFFGSPATDRVAVAKVNEAVLYEDELAGIFNKGISVDDSLQRREDFIKTWIKEELIFQKALANLPDSITNKEDSKIGSMLHSYYRSLVRYAYENALVNEKLDTAVSKAEIASYYKENLKSFELRRNVLKMIFLKIPVDAPELEEVKKWYRSNDQEQLDLLRRYCQSYAAQFSIDDPSWYFLDEVMAELPPRGADAALLLASQGYIEVSDSAHHYLIHTKEFRKKGEYSPLSLEEKKIRNIILNRRKVELIHQMESSIFTDAVETGKFEVKNEQAP